MNQNSDPAPLLESSIDPRNRETSVIDPRSSKTEESKERISMGEYEEGLSNINIQEEFFFDTGNRRIVSVTIVLKCNALYISHEENNEICPENFSLFF